MKHSMKYMDRIRTVFSATYRERAAADKPLDSQWRQSVMQSVRQSKAGQSDAGEWLGFSLLAWRLAPAALALMILLGVLIMRTDDAIEYQLAGLMVSEPVQISMTFQPL